MLAIADDVWQLPLAPRDAVNAYLIGDVLVDTGIPQSADKIAGMLEGRSISAIALTHAHADHAGAMRRVADRYGVPVWCGAQDREAAETGRVVLAPAFRRPRLNALVGATAGFESAPVARTLAEGDSLAPASPCSTRPGTPPATSRSGARRTAR